MKQIVIRSLVVLAVLAVCVLAVYPPQDRIRLGKDLRGGVSLVYTVNVPDDGNPDETMRNVIDVLKRRINPQGVLDVSIQQIGRDRLEIVMPLPNAEVQGLRQEYQKHLDEILAQAEIDPDAVRQALEASSIAQMFAGDSALAAKAAALQTAFNDVKTQRAELSRLKTENAAAELVQAQEFKVASAELEEEKLRNEVLSLSLDKPRFIRMLSLSDEPLEEFDAKGRPILDDSGKTTLGPSARDVELEDLKRSFPHLASKMDDVVAAFDRYNARRTSLDDPEDLKRLLRGAGVLEFRIAVSASKPEGVNPQDMRRQLQERGPANTDSPVAGWFPINDLKQWYKTPDQLEALRANPVGYFAQRSDIVAAEHQGEFYVLLYTTDARSMTHAGGRKWAIQSAFRTADDLGRPAVGFSLDQPGGMMMGRLTGPHVNQSMAIVLDGQVYSAPNLNSQISGRGIIQGTFSAEELDYLIRVLVAGTLEARLSTEPISTNVLGSSLGEENLRSGMMACVISVAATMAFMLLYYFFAGIVANIALLFTTVMIFGVCALIDSTFTLPGLAGMALTAGMAVDSNVLIYERIREEMVNNKESLRTAIRLGFSRAFNAIVDGHATNLVVCCWLVMLATTEVKGFAVVMIIGTVATLFTALFLTRTILLIYSEVFKAKSLPMLPTVIPGLSRALEPSIDWMGKRYVFYTISFVTSVIGLVAVFSLGSRILDMEFRGGVVATMMTREALPGEKADDEGRLLMRRADVEREVHEIGEAAGPGDPEVYELRNASVLTVGESVGDFEASSFQIKVANAAIDRNADPIDEVVGAIVKRFADRLNVTPALTFRGSDGQTDPAQFYHLLNKDRLGDAIRRPALVQPIGNFRGGVGIVLEDISPPVKVRDVESRIDRMRRQAGYSKTIGREVRVVGVEPVDPGDPTRGYRSVAVLVRDSRIDGTKFDLSLWDRQLARVEWSLITEALTRSPSLDQVSSFSSAMADTLSAQAFVAVILSLLCIVGYIWFRFNSLRYSLAAIVATVHDLCVALGLLAISHYVAHTAFGRAIMLEEFRIDLNVVAALLTLIGYSLNDTVVILDRIRENRGKLPLASAEVINRSINQTMSRTLITGGTTMVSLLVLYIMGGPSIRPFSFVLLLGLIVGTYSSVAIAAPLVYSKRIPKRSEEPGASAGLLPSAASAT
jgi:SecD/SecF fusion protein